MVFIAAPLLLIYLHWYFYLHIKMVRQFIEEIPPNGDKTGIFPWVITQDFIIDQGNPLDIRALWVEFALWHFWPSCLIVMSLASIRVQSEPIMVLGIAAGLISMMLSANFRKRYYRKQATRPRYVYWIMRVVVFLLLFLNIFMVGIALSKTNMNDMDDGLIKRGVAAIIGIDCSNQIFSAQSGGGSSLIADRRSLKWASFRSAIIPGFRCDDCNLQNSDWRGAVIYNGKFKNANLIGASFKDATCINCDFTKAHLEYADFSRANLKSSNMKGATLLGAVFAETKIDSIEFGEFQAEGAATFYKATGWLDPVLEASLRANHTKLFNTYLTD